MSARHIAVLDVGKTNAKLVLVDAATLDEIDVLTRPNRVLPAPPWPHFDVVALWTFCLDGLARLHAAHGVDAISVTTHGAAVALLDRDGGLAAPILDYEHDGPDTVAAEYDAIRPPFAETGSPRRGGGLNLGAQLYWQFGKVPGLQDRVQQIVPYPQFWGARLTGVAASDVTSLGCHTDLWAPFERRASSLVARLGVTVKLAPTRRPTEVLGRILPEIAEATGLSRETVVYCGIHDSNASLLPHLLGRKAPFGVVSTGTWVIAMAVGGAAVALDPARDTLVNVNALGDPVPSARFMGGREFDILTEGQGADVTEADIQRVLAAGTMVLPSVVQGSGPYPARKMRWIGEAPAVGSGRRMAAVSFYLALVTARCLSLAGHCGPVVVEGPFARNDCYLSMLATAADASVCPVASATGTAQGAALLAIEAGGAGALPAPGAPVVDPVPAYLPYCQAWRDRVAEPSAFQST